MRLNGGHVFILLMIAFLHNRVGHKMKRKNKGDKYRSSAISYNRNPKFHTTHATHTHNTHARARSLGRTSMRFRSAVRAASFLETALRSDSDSSNAAVRSEIFTSRHANDVGGGDNVSVSGNDSRDEIKRGSAIR